LIEKKLSRFYEILKLSRSGDFKRSSNSEKKMRIIREEETLVFYEKR